jgi:nitrilase
MKTGGSPFMGCDVIGSSAVFGPDGRAITSSETKNEELVFADLDFDAVVKVKTFFDANGHCIQPAPESKACVANKGATDSRPDLLWLGADPRSKKSVRPE